MCYFLGEAKLKFIFTLILSGIVSVVGSPFYLSLMPSVDAVAAKVIVFFVVWIVLLLMLGKS